MAVGDDRARPPGAVDVEHARARDTRVETVEQRQMTRFGDDGAAVGVTDVGSQFLAPAGRVDADDGGTRERGTTEKEHVLGHVVEQHADVEGPVGPQRLEPRRARRALTHDSGPRPRLVFEPQTDVLVVRARGEQLRDRRFTHHAFCNMRATMATGSVRDEAQIAAGFASWLTSELPDHRNARVERVERPSAGWSNETVLLTCRSDGAEADERLVLRMPSVVPSYPDDALAAQAAVHATLRAAGVPVPAWSRSSSTMRGWAPRSWCWNSSRVTFPAKRPGSTPGSSKRPRIGSARSRRASSARSHSCTRSPWQSSPVDGLLRRGLAAEVDYWIRYADWASEGRPPAALVAALEWCRTTMPADEPAAALLWGDARLGNVMYGSDYRVVSLLDWELATLGPPEMDLAWYLALDELTTKATRSEVPGFHPREQFVARYELQLGRPVVDLAWHEVFALVRSVAVNDKQARLAAAAGVPYPGVFGDENPMLGYVGRRIERFNAATS